MPACRSICPRADSPAVEQAVTTAPTQAWKFTLLLNLQVTIRDLDPKSISTQELYGYVNMSTREWKDGLLSYNMRELANQPDDNPKWILLDGDLDANW